MGWTVLYIAFGIVALWLLGEVLLQYKARLRWRLLAFAGFLGVVFGVLIPSVVVIGVGAAAFAVGQTYVTLSFRRGFAAGWAVGNRSREDGDSKRRRGEGAHQDPELEPEDGDLETTGAGTYHQGGAYDDDHDNVFSGQQPMESAAESTAVYEPQPMPEDTGSYGVYTHETYAAAADASYAGAGQPQDQQAYAYDSYAGYGQQQYGYDNGQQQYAAYTDPYQGTQTYGGSYDQSYGGQQQYGQQAYGQDQYATGTYGETPAGGVWVPQQRTTEDGYGGELPPEQQYPYQGQANQTTQGHGHGHGFDEQYRF
ncbi:SCO2102 family sporulation regulator [Streptomyces sp. NPDC055722]